MKTTADKSPAAESLSALSLSMHSMVGEMSLDSYIPDIVLLQHYRNPPVFMPVIFTYGPNALTIRKDDNDNDIQ